MTANLDIEIMRLYPGNMGYRKKTNKMKNMNTTLEIPEGSKATIQGKVIDGVADAVNDCLCRICDSGNMDKQLINQ
jgi:protocatechuate 3,4-dioxygenase beta subunit